MNRRQFLQSIILIPLSTYIKNATATATAIESLLVPAQNTTIKKGNTVPVAGFQYYQGENLWQQLKIKDQLSLKREPENKFDENAIVIQWQGQKLGYIPRISNSSYALQMDTGDKITAEIIGLSESSNPWKRVEVLLYREV